MERHRPESSSNRADRPHLSPIPSGAGLPQPQSENEQHHHRPLSPEPTTERAGGLEEVAALAGQPEDRYPRPARRLKEHLTRILTCIQLSPTSSNQPQSHSLSRPVILHSGYSMCSSCYDASYARQDRRREPAHLLDPRLPHSGPDPPPTLIDHDPGPPSINFLIQKIIDILNDPTHTDGRSIEATLRAELECPLCALLLSSPSTTSCGHTFCLSCLLRARDHSTYCPVCRAPSLSDRHTVPPIDLTLDRLLLKCFGPDRGPPRSDHQTLPLLVCSIGFPTMPMFLQVLEPTYQLMIRRAVSNNDPIGVVIPAFDHHHHDYTHNQPPYSFKIPTTDPTQPNLPVHQYGTILEILKCDTLVDGTLLVESRGLSRFRVRYLSGQLDGYLIAKVQVFHDSLVVDERPEERTITESLTRTCKEFIEILKSGCTPWIVERVENTFGSMPEDPVRFSYWIAMLLPISDQQKAGLLPITGCRVRLMIIVGWIETLKAQWRARGCSIV